MAGAGTISRTLSRLRRSDNSPEAKARRAARKAKAAAARQPRRPPRRQPQGRYRRSRSLLWALLAIGVVVAAIAGWYLPSRAPDARDVANLVRDAGAARAPTPNRRGIDAFETAPPATALPPLPTIVERELVPHSHAADKPATSKRVAAAPKAVAPPPEAPAEVEVVRVPPPEPAPPAPQPAPRIDPWQQMSEAIGRCPAGFLDRVVCEQRVRLQYCEGQWGQVPQCPGGPSVDHN